MDDARSTSVVVELVDILLCMVVERDPEIDELVSESVAVDVTPDEAITAPVEISALRLVDGCTNAESVIVDPSPVVVPSGKVVRPQVDVSSVDIATLPVDISTSIVVEGFADVKTLATAALTVDVSMRGVVTIIDDVP